MLPYRESTALTTTDIPKPESSLKKWWRNRRRRLGLWFWGTWKYRFYRCSECGLRLRRNHGDDMMGFEETFNHRMMHQGEREARVEFAMQATINDLIAVSNKLKSNPSEYDLMNAHRLMDDAAEILKKVPL